MASKHEQIKWNLITDWSQKGRGRLYCMNQGMATPLDGDNPIWFGPLKMKFKGFPDLVGFEFKTVKYPPTTEDEIWDSETFPIYTVIEVKTKAYPTLSAAQKRYMNYAVSIGARAYVAMETDDGYELRPWTEV